MEFINDTICYKTDDYTCGWEDLEYLGEGTIYSINDVVQV